VNIIVVTQLSRSPTLHIPKLSNLSRVVVYTKKKLPKLQSNFGSTTFI